MSVELSDTINTLARQVVEACQLSRTRIATAESCTGGLISAALTEIPGSSEALDRGFVTYSNAAKAAMLAVPEATLARFGAVSEATARAMAEGALRHSVAELAIAVTGIAGPGGGSLEKPVGRVHIALAGRTCQTVHEQHDFGPLTRREIRERTVLRALEMICAGLRPV